MAASGEPAAAPPTGIATVATATPAAAYTPPAWAAAPPAGMALEVVKGGVVVGTLPLRGPRSWLLVGRQPDVCDVVIDDDSASRQHAVLQFGGGGELYVVDMGSTHGTRVNKVPAAPKQYVHAPVGSVLSFGTGAGGRLYIVTGPPELAPEEEAESAEHAAFRAASEARQARKAAAVAAAPAARAGTSSSSGGGDAGWRASELPSEEAAIAATMAAVAHAVESGGTGGGGGDDDDGSAAGRGAATLRALEWMDSVELARLSAKEREAWDKLVARRAKLAGAVAAVARMLDKAAGHNPLARAGRGREELEGSLSERAQAQLARTEESIDKQAAAVAEEADALRERLGVGSSEPGAAAAAAHRAKESVLLTDALAGEVDDMTDMARGAAAASTGAARPMRFVFAAKRATSAQPSAPPVAAAPRAAPTVPVVPAPPAAPVPSSVSSGARAGAGARHRDDDSDDDDVGVNDRRAPSHAALVVELAGVEDEIALLEAAVARRAAASADTAGAGAGGGDELDAYMNATAATVASQQAAADAATLRRLQARAATLTRLVELSAAVAAPLAAAPAPPPAAPAAVRDAAVAVSAAPPPPPPPPSAPQPSAVVVAGVKRAAAGPLLPIATTAAPPPPPKRAREAAPQYDVYDDEAGASAAGWAPPPGQTGDGRTSLNAKFGY